MAVEVVGRVADIASEVPSSGGFGSCGAVGRNAREQRDIHDEPSQGSASIDRTG